MCTSNPPTVVGSFFFPTVRGASRLVLASALMRAVLSASAAFNSANNSARVAPGSSSVPSRFICSWLRVRSSAYVSRRSKLRATCRTWNATGAAPAGRAFTSRSERLPHHFRKSSSASCRACRTARPTAGTSGSVPRNHGSADSADGMELLRSRSRFPNSFALNLNHHRYLGQSQPKVPAVSNP